MHKHLKSFLAVIIAFCISFNFAAVKAKGTDTNKTNDTDTSLVEVYDGFGNLVYECETLEEAEEFIYGETWSSFDQNDVHGTRSASSFF